MICGWLLTWLQLVDGRVLFYVRCYNCVVFCGSMAFLESHEIYHGNIKPSNLFVSSDGFNICVGDFCPPSELDSYSISWRIIQLVSLSVHRLDS